MNDKTIYTINVSKTKVLPCPLRVKYVRIIDEDDNGFQYRKTVKYMENTVTTSFQLADLLIEANKSTRTVVNYIIKHLAYNQTVIQLKNKTICDETGLYPADVVKAIKYLKENDVIRKMREIEGYENDNMFSQHDYFVNPNFIFHGSINTLVKQN